MKKLNMPKYMIVVLFVVAKVFAVDKNDPTQVYTAHINDRLKNVKAQIQNLKPITQQTMRETKKIWRQKKRNIANQLKQLNVQAIKATATAAQKKTFAQQKAALDNQVAYINKMLALGNDQLLNILQDKQNKYKQNLNGIANRLEAKLNNKTQLAKEAKAYSGKKQAIPKATSLVSINKGGIQNNNFTNVKPNYNQATANLFILEPSISSIEDPDADNLKQVVTNQKYTIKNSRIPISQWINVVDKTPSALQTDQPLFTVSYDSENTTFFDGGNNYKDNSFVDVYQKAINNGGPRSMSLTDKDNGIISFDDVSKKGYISIEPVCLSGGMSSAYGTAIIQVDQTNGGNVITIYNSNPNDGLLNDNIYVYKFDLQKFWDKRNEFSGMLAHSNIYPIDISKSLPVASVNFKVSFNMVTNEMDVTPYFAFAGGACDNKNLFCPMDGSYSMHGFMPSLELQNSVMPDIKQWLLSEGIVTIVPNLSADKDLASIFNYPCQTQSTGN